MGSCMSDIYKDIEAYEELCKYLNVESKDISSMHEHEKELMKKYGYERTYFGYQKVKKNKRS